MSNYCMNSRSQNMRKAISENYRMTNNMHHVETLVSAECTTHIHWNDMPIAMAYVPKQKYGELFDLTKAMQIGTIFPELCKPFCGKGGGC